MGILETIILAFGLSMDAFAVSVCKGLAVENCSLREASICGIWFGGFQALMPLIGYFLGRGFREYITAIDHWIAFVLLLAIGINMIRESREDSCSTASASFGPKQMFPMAVATSIDALAMGITLAFLRDSNIYLAISLIGIITFLMSGIGAKIGNVFGANSRAKAQLAGGIILIALGCKILLEHLGIISFSI